MSASSFAAVCIARRALRRSAKRTSSESLVLTRICYAPHICRTSSATPCGSSVPFDLHHCCCRCMPSRYSPIAPPLVSYQPVLDWQKHGRIPLDNERSSYNIDSAVSPCWILYSVSISYKPSSGGINASRPMLR